MGRPDGGWISGYTAPNTEGARGVWSLRDAYQAQRGNIWPVSIRAATELLLHLNGTNGSTTVADTSPRPKAVTAGGAFAIATATSKFGGASGSFTGASSFLSIADQDAIELGNKTFAMEMWIATTSNTQFATIASRVPSSYSTGMWTWVLNNASATAGDLALYVQEASAGALLAGGSGLRDGAWHHVAVARSGSSWSMYVDGTRVATATSSVAISNINGALYIGRDQTNGRQFVGNIDEFRLVIGKVADYGPATITVPTAEYPDL